MRSIAVIFILFLSSCAAGLCAFGAGSDAAKPVSFCEVLRKPAKYANKTVTVTVRVLSTKEGASLWSPDCRMLGVWLRIESDAKTGPGMVALHQALAQHGLGDHPVVATLTGVFDPDHYDDITNRKRPVLRVIAAQDITRARDVERR